MVFNWSNESGCSQNSSDTYNASALTPQSNITKADINRLRLSVEQLYSNLYSSASAWVNDTQEITENLEIREEHINELRWAVNRLRATVQVMWCDSHCASVAQCPSWHATGCGWFCNHHGAFWSTPLGNFNFSSGAESSTKVTVQYQQLKKYIIDLRNQIDGINDTDCTGGYGSTRKTGQYQTF